LATRVQIKKALEERLRKATGNELAAEIVKLLDEENAKREAGSTRVKDGLGYKELVSLFRFHLGSDLVLPPEPNTTWIIRMVNTARQMGVKQDNVEQIIRGLRRQYPRGPYQLGFILQRADVHFAAGEAVEQTTEGEATKTSRVYTGRDDLGGE
jgi:hypothetical protein